jgi:hypothetical protein
VKLRIGTTTVQAVASVAAAAPIATSAIETRGRFATKTP